MSSLQFAQHIGSIQPSNNHTSSDHTSIYSDLFRNVRYIISKENESIEIEFGRMMETYRQYYFNENGLERQHDYRGIYYDVPYLVDTTCNREMRDIMDQIYDSLCALKRVLKSQFDKIASTYEAEKMFNNQMDQM